MTDHLELAQQYGFLIPEHGLATSADEAVRIAAGIGRRVALKIASPDVIHKTDVGGVELDLSTEESVLAAYERIVNSVKERAPSAHVIGVSVEEMYYGGTEVIVGLNEDPQFGPVIMFGLGGIFTEVYQDIAFRVVPISECDARSMIREINGHPNSDGISPPASRVGGHVGRIAHEDQPHGLESRGPVQLGGPQPSTRVGRPAQGPGREDIGAV